MRLLLAGDGVFADRTGGGRRYLWDLATLLVAAGHRVDVVGPRLSLELPSRETRNGVRIIRHAAPSGTAPWKVLARIDAARRSVQALLGRHSYDVVNVHFAQTGFGGLLAGAGRSVPLLYHFQGPWAGEIWTERRATWEGHKGPGTASRRGLALTVCTVMHRLERRGVRAARRVAVLSRFSRSVLERAHGVPWEQVLVVPGGFDPSRFPQPASRQDARTALGLTPGPPVIFTARRLVRRMGLELLLKAAAQLHERGVIARWFIAGAGPLEATLRQRIAALGLSEQVRILGRVPDADLPTWYGAADLCVVPSIAFEGFGLVSVEALACGTPVVVTPAGANPEVVRPLSPALVAGAVTVKALSATIARALAGPLPSPQDCRDYAVGRFGWDAVYPLNEAALRWVAES